MDERMDKQPKNQGDGKKSSFPLAALKRGTSRAKDPNAKKDPSAPKAKEASAEKAKKPPKEKKERGPLSLPFLSKKGKDQASDGGSAASPTDKIKLKKKKKRRKMIAALLVVVIAGCGGGFAYLRSRQAAAAASAASEQRTATVERRSISSELSSSGTLSPKDTYEITSLVEGEVISADFEEGDEVEEGQVLYLIDSSSMETQLTSATNSLARAQKNYQSAVDDYNEIQAKISGNTYKATKSGYISEMLIEEGDSVGSSTQICSIYNDEIMKLKVPFLSGEAAIISQGMTAYISLSDTGEELLGTVSSVSAREEVLTGGTLVRYVTIEVENPGGLTTSMAATATIGDCYCVEEGSFEPTTDTIMIGDLDGTIKVEALLVTEGSYITNGTPIFQITADSAADLLDSYENAVDNALSSVESAETQLETTQDSYDDYTITAPISGQVITKSYKVGDVIDKSGSSTISLAVIYDLSELTFEMSIDELDIMSVEVGQKVEVTADAFEDQTFSGTVTNISLQSTYSSGVTTYPVTVTMDDVGDLLPGMNVDGVIILDSVEDVLSIPVDSLMRGNQVYVRDDTVTEADGSVPAGFRAVEVETGLISDDYVEIISGLEEGQEVYVAESSTDSSSAFMMPGGGGGGGMPGGGGGGGGAPGGGGGGMR